MALRIGSRLLENIEQRQITLDQRLEKPVLLQGTGVHRPDVGQVCVQYQGKSAIAHWPTAQE